MTQPSDHRLERLPRTLKLTDGVRLDGDRFSIRAHVFRGAVQIATEDVRLSIDDASVMNAQLTRLLDQRAFPGMDERERARQRARWGY
ncbi:hypothetical protein ACZ90_52630 [Streptomyces albus subsp. albus]|nr:hypothetical protein ACZ90_52630 [Streptomyces albus subsp. albus]